MKSSINFLDPHSKEVRDLFEPTILRRLQKEKRGQGLGKDYKPFLTVRDVPSKGRVHRRPSMTHNRIVHLLSDLELAVFLLFDWSSAVFDIREQFPLNPQTTIDIARRLGIKHPAYRGVLQVMTTDFLIDVVADNGKLTPQAISAKYESDLEDERVIEKLEIERRFWESEEVEWFSITEKDIPKRLVANIRWIAPHINSYNLDANTRMEVFHRILRDFDSNPNEKIATLLREIDKTQGERPGTYLQYFRHLAAQNAFSWEMTKYSHRSLDAKNINISEYWQNNETVYVHSK